jgi:hypothetical protein
MNKEEKVKKIKSSGPRPNLRITDPSKQPRGRPAGTKKQIPWTRKAVEQIVQSGVDPVEGLLNLIKDCDKQLFNLKKKAEAAEQGNNNFTKRSRLDDQAMVAIMRVKMEALKFLTPYVYRTIAPDDPEAASSISVPKMNLFQEDDTS